MPFKKYVELTDPVTIRALSHPARPAILTHLHEDGPATATELSRRVGGSPSGCSYHLRTLAKLGFVKEEKSKDGRERRWRVVISGYGIPKRVQDSPEVLAAARLWGHRWVENHEDALHAYLAADETFPPVWRKATTMYGATLHLTPDQLIDFGNRYLAMVDAYEDQETSPEKPKGSRPVHLSFIAIPAVDGSAKPAGAKPPVRRSRQSAKKRGPSRP